MINELNTQDAFVSCDFIWFSLFPKNFRYLNELVLFSLKIQVFNFIGAMDLILTKKENHFLICGIFVLPSLLNPFFGSWFSLDPKFSQKNAFCLLTIRTVKKAQMEQICSPSCEGSAFLQFQFLASKPIRCVKLNGRSGCASLAPTCAGDVLLSTSADGVVWTKEQIWKSAGNLKTLKSNAIDNVNQEVVGGNEQLSGGSNGDNQDGNSQVKRNDIK